jgi:enterochelin esterase-like enzyme
LVGSDVGYTIALPKDYHSSSERYPVVYFLHGASGDENSYWDITIPNILHAEPALEPVIVVFVNGGTRTFYTNSPDGKRPVESVMIDELIPHIDRTYRTKADRSQRSIEGQSMGGFGALSLAMRNPDEFGSVVAYAPALVRLTKENDMWTLGTMTNRHSFEFRSQTFEYSFGANPGVLNSYDPFEVLTKNADALRDKLAIRLVVGDEDNLAKDCEELHRLLVKLQYDHEFEIVPGAGHDARQLFKDGAYATGIRFHERSRK